MPTFNEGAANWPLLEVRVVALALVAMLKIVIWASGITAPLGSRTLPAIVPVSTWAIAPLTKTAKASMHRSKTFAGSSNIGTLFLSIPVDPPCR